MPGSLPTMGSLLKLFLPLCGFRPTHSVLLRVVISTCNHHRYVLSPQVLDTSYQFRYKPTPPCYSVTFPVFMCVVCAHISPRQTAGIILHYLSPLSRVSQEKKIRACQYGFGDPMFLPSEDYHIHQTFMWVSGDACLVSTKTPVPSPQPSTTVFICSIG